MKKVFVSASVLLSAIPLFAQNLNPKVQVVNDYDVSVAESSKSGVGMSVPDSLMRFEYNFDYNTFESAYKGAYDVSQYFIKTRPSAVPVKRNRFRLEAGAGYNLRPELRFNWDAVHMGRYELSLDNDFRGAYGSFNSVSGKNFTGYDFSENLAFTNMWRLDKSVIGVNLAYDGIFNSFEFAAPSNSCFNSAVAEFRVASPEKSLRNFHYDLGLAYRFANDNCREFGILNENYFCLDGRFGTVIREKFKLFLDFDAEYDANSGTVSSRAFRFDINPHVGMRFGILDMTLGLDLSYSAKPDDSGVSPRFGIFPDVRMNVRLCDDYFNIFAGVTGEQKMLSYSGLKFMEHAYRYDFGMLGQSYNKWVDAFVGFSGFALNSFEYMVKAGYELNDGRPLAAYNLETKLPEFYGMTYHKAYASAMLGWNDERIESDLTFNFGKCWFEEQKSWPQKSAVFDEPLFELKANFTYNWFRRFYAGAMCEWRSASRVINRDDYRDTPAFVNLGVNFRYQFNDRLGIWLKGANLLNQELWYSDFYARKGVECTLGVTLVL